MKKYTPSKYTSYMLFFLPMFFAMFMDFSREPDTWFLLSHGRYVLNNGIPYTEILSMHSDFSFMMQQWLSATVFYGVYKLFGEFGLYIFYLLMCGVVTYLIYRLCMIISNKKIYVSTLVTVISILMLQLNYIEVRPQLFSYVILLVLMILLQLFYKDENNKMIYLLPVISIVLINFHAAFFPMFIIICMPYLAEYLLKKDKRFIKLLIIIFISCLTSLINPYGMDALTYGFSSYGVGNTKEFVIEMMPFDLSNKVVLMESFEFLGLFLLANTIMIFSNKKEKLKIHTILYIYGFFFMGLIGMKNVSFYYLFALPFVCKFINIKDGKDTFIPYKTYALLGIILLSFFCINLYRGSYKLESGIEDVVTYLDKNASKDITLYTDYHTGSYVEFDGYKPYIDSRAEVYLKKNNGKKDVLDEYYKLLKGTLDMDKFIDTYKFDYIMVNSYEKFYEFIKNNDDYELVYEGKNKITFLFKRKYSQT